MLTNDNKIRCNKCSTIISHPMSKYSRTTDSHHEECDAFELIYSDDIGLIKKID